MTITDYSCCDFIEIFNNPEPLHEVNEKGVKLWENLVLSGEKLAATCGMDLHGNSTLHGHYSTYIQGEPDGDEIRGDSAGNSPMRSTTSVPGYARDLCWKYITMEKHSPSPSTRPENRDTKPLIGDDYKIYPPHQRSGHHLQRLRPDPAGFFCRACYYYPDAFRERNHYRKPRMYKPCDVSVRQHQ